MCTYKISIDDALLERVRPAFTDNVEIGTWMQSQIESLSSVDKDMTVEEAYDLVCKDLQMVLCLLN